MSLRKRTVATMAAGTISLTGWAVIDVSGASAAGSESAHSAATSAKPAAKPAADPRLKILLTNDDGWDKAGITAAYEALTAAGHDVTLVAPSVNQSGMSAAMPDAELHVEQPTSDPKVFHVNSTPANAMDVGVLAIMDERPDLVVSGINSGANTGAFIGMFGTVGATVAARSLYGIPGIAISLEQSSTDKTDYFDAARLLVNIIDQGINAIAAGTILNVNYPELDSGRTAPADVVYAEPSNAVPWVWDYTVNDDGSVDFDYSIPPPPASGDMAEIAKDNATLTLIRTTPGGLGVPAPHARRARALAAALN